MFCIFEGLCPVYVTTVLTEGGQVRGGDQGPDRQAKGGELELSVSHTFMYPKLNFK